MRNSPATSAIYFRSAMKHISKLSQAGFSLVEVALSVAIAALAIITLLGLGLVGLGFAHRKKN